MDLPKTTTEQRAEIYEDIRKLLHPGFIAHSVMVNDTRLVFRSLNEHDWDLLRFRTQNDTLLEWKRWSVAVSAWMVGGQVTTGDEGLLYRMYQMCSSLPRTILDDIYEVVNALLRRVRNATQLMSGFLYEDESRFLWRAEGVTLFSANILIPGMAPNPVQKLWAFYNTVEDDSVKDRNEWEIAKFIVGPHAPKGIKKITAKDKQQLEEMTRKREREMDRCFYEATGMIPKRGETVSKKGRRGSWDVEIAETEEELQEQMRKWVAGDKDLHDDVVDDVKARIKTEVEGRKARAKAQQEALSRAMKEEGVTKSQLVPMTGPAAEAFIERVKKRMPGVSTVLQDATHNSAYDKYIKNNAEVGTLAVDDHGNIITSAPVDREEMVEMLRKPEEGEQQDLQEQIAARRPTMDDLQKDPGKGRR